MNDYLKHHGVIGQKWGVKHGPPYPLKSVYSNGHRITGSEKAQKTQVEDGGHRNNSKSEAVLFATNILLDVATLNPVGLGLDIHRATKAFVSSHRNKKYKSERDENLNVDSETGLKRKSDEQQLTEIEDLKRVNPNVGDFNSDSKNNCMLCTATYEMRRRGYDVTAQRDGVGFVEDDIKRWFPKAETKHISKDESGKFIDPGRGKRYVEKAIDTLEHEPDGSRGNLMVTFALGGRHSVSYEIENGKLIIRDAQVAKIYKNPKSILNKCTDFYYTRYDNLDFDRNGIKEVCYS